MRKKAKSKRNERKEIKSYRLKVCGLDVEVTQKAVKYIYIRIDSRTKGLRVSAPLGCSARDIERAVKKRFAQIERGLKRMEQIRPPERGRIEEGALHPFLGRLYPIKIHPQRRQGLAEVELRDDRIELFLPPGLEQDELWQIMAGWHRFMLKQRVLDMIPGWQRRMNVSVRQFRIRRMKTRWGSCNTRASRIWLNLELSIKRVELIEYVLVHEMVHLLEASHNRRFKSLMDRFLPDWRRLKTELDTSPPALLV